MADLVFVLPTYNLTLLPSYIGNLTLISLFSPFFEELDVMRLCIHRAVSLEVCGETPEA